MLSHISPLLAFLAGLVSFLSPCVLPLVPAYIAYLGGRAGDDEAPTRARLVLAGAAFVIGLTAVFVLMAPSSSRSVEPAGSSGPRHPEPGTRVVSAMSRRGRPVPQFHGRGRAAPVHGALAA